MACRFYGHGAWASITAGHDISVLMHRRLGLWQRAGVGQAWRDRYWTVAVYVANANSVRYLAVVDDFGDLVRVREG